MSVERRLKGQTLQGYLRANLQQIERLLLAGVRYAEIAEALVAAGFEEGQCRTLKVSMFRARKQARRGVAGHGGSAAGVTVPAQEVAVGNRAAQNAVTAPAPNERAVRRVPKTQDEKVAALPPLDSFDTKSLAKRMDEMTQIYSGFELPPEEE